MADRAQFRTAVVFFNARGDAELSRFARVCLESASAVEWGCESHRFRAASGMPAFQSAGRSCARINRANNREEDPLAIPVFSFKCTHVDVGARWYLDASRSPPLYCAKLLRVFALASVSSRAGIYLARAFASRLTRTRARAQPAQNEALEFMQGDARGTRCEMFAIAHPLTSYTF